MRPALFAYHAPDTLEEVLRLTAEHGDSCRVLAGGQSLMPSMNFRTVRPEVLVDINRVPGLSQITVVDGATSVGALVRQRQAERSPSIVEHVPLMALVLPHIAHTAVRNRGTIGGSIANADSAAELPATAMALDAIIVAESAARGRREIPAAEFFVAAGRSSLMPDEVLTELRFPHNASLHVSFREVSRRHAELAVVGVAAGVSLSDGVISDVRIALLGVARTPVRARDAEHLLLGEEPTPKAFTEAARTAGASLRPPSDVHATGEYRRRVAQALIKDMLLAATASARS